MKKLMPFIKIYYKIILSILVVIGLFYWFQLRPANTRSYCSQWSLIRAKAETNGYIDNFTSDHPDTNVEEITSYLARQYKTDGKFRLGSYNQSNYNENYSRCMHEHGI